MVDDAVSQLCLDVKVSGASITLLDVQALLAVFYRPATYAVGVSMFLTSTALYPVGELTKILSQRAT